MKKIAITFMPLFLFFIPAVLFAAEEITVDENELFADPEIIIQSETLKNDNSHDDENKKSLGISGEITSANVYINKKNAVDSFNQGDEFKPFILGSLFADMRLPSNIKGFGDFEAAHDAGNDETSFSMKEMFIDFNIARAVYFRTGKQLLQWGRCYLWNPTDVINIEKKPFLTKIGAREGTYGIKAHVPFGTKANMYGFADTNRTNDIKKIAGAYKFEYLIGSAEMAFSVWGKQNYYTVYGYDVSTNMLDIDIAGEASVSRGSNTKKIQVIDGILTPKRERGKYITKASIDFGHAFDFNDQPDKVQINLEFFYNGDGYKENILADDNIYQYDSPLTIEIDNAEHVIPMGTKATYMFGKNLYEMNYYSRYYAALFTSINKFFISELTFALNLISNIQQKSFILSSGLNYSNINDFKAGIELYSFFGEKDTEYTFMKYQFEALLTFGIVF